jgi:hypothetical protein
MVITHALPDDESGQVWNRRGNLNVIEVNSVLTGGKGRSGSGPVELRSE